MSVLVILLVGGMAGSPLPDCGRAAHRSTIALTEKLIVKTAPLEIPYVELGHGAGEEECVRFVFNISDEGAATDIEVAESSNNIVMNLAAVRALKKYSFRTAIQGPVQTNTLVFVGRVGGEMPYSPKDR